MRIRRAERADEERLGTIRHDAILALAVPILSQEEAETWAKQISEDRISRAVRAHEVWVAEDEIVNGWVEINKNQIAALYVSPDYAGRGIGSSLLAFAEASIFRSGYRSVQLEASRNALNFYVLRDYIQHGLPDAEGAYPLRKELSASERVYQDTLSIQSYE